MHLCFPQIFTFPLNSIHLMSNTKTEHETLVFNTLDIPLQLNLLSPSFTPSQVPLQIKHLPERKASSYELITVKRFDKNFHLNAKDEKLHWKHIIIKY